MSPPAGDPGRFRDRPSSPHHAPIAFVLTGGATRGAAHVGMLRALTESGIRPDFVVGTSVGALNAAVYAQDPTPAGLEHLAQLWIRAPRAQIFPLRPRAIAVNVREHRGHLLDNGGLRRWIETHAAYERLEDFPIPVHAVASDADSGEPVVLSTGDTVQALLATSAIPGVFPTIEIEGRRLQDGAAVADNPLPQALELGAVTTYVLPTAPPGPIATTPTWQLLDRIFGNPVEEQVVAEPADATVHVLPAPQPDGNPFSFRASRRLIDQAHALTRAHLDGAPPPTFDAERAADRRLRLPTASRPRRPSGSRPRAGSDAS